MDWKLNFWKVTSCIIHLHPPAVLVMAFKSKLEGYNEAEELLGCTLNVTPRLFFIVTYDLEWFKDHFTVETRLVSTPMSHIEGYTCWTRADKKTSPSIGLLITKQPLADDLGWFILLTKIIHYTSESHRGLHELHFSKNLARTVLRNP